MLILTRKKGEKIFIGNDIEVMVMKVDGGQVRIGIQAPVGVVVLREEVALRNAAAEKQGA